MSRKSKSSHMEVPEAATFMWRKGLWFLQNNNDAMLQPASKRLAKMLDRLKDEGSLVEKAPGLFRLSGAATKPLINKHESPLTRLAHTRQSDGQMVLDAEQWRAGERLRQDYERAHLATRITASYEPRPPSVLQTHANENTIEKMTDNTLAARQAVHRALDSVGPELSGILLQVCCLDSGLEAAERRLDFPRRAGKAVLQLALTRLARHYGYKQTVRHAGPSKIGHWAIADFRPEIATPPPHQP